MSSGSVFSTTYTQSGTSECIRAIMGLSVLPKDTWTYGLRGQVGADCSTCLALELLRIKYQY